MIPASGNQLTDRREGCQQRLQVAVEGGEEAEGGVSRADWLKKAFYKRSRSDRIILYSG